MKVIEFMTKDPVCCVPSASLQEAAVMMADNNCGCIPVVDDAKRPIGTITDRDIIIRALAQSKDPMNMTVGDVMSASPVSLGEDATFEECYRTMEKNQIRRILVVNSNNQCVGIVAQADIALKAGCENETAELVREVSAQSFSAAGG